MVKFRFQEDKWFIQGYKDSNLSDINNHSYADDTTLMAEREEELKSLLMRVKEERERAGLRLNIKKKIKIMASSPITAWQIEGEKVEAMIYFLLLGSKITVDGVCSHEIRRQLLLGRKLAGKWCQT